MLCTSEVVLQVVHLLDLILIQVFPSDVMTVQVVSSSNPKSTYRLISRGTNGKLQM